MAKINYKKNKKHSHMNPTDKQNHSEEKEVNEKVSETSQETQETAFAEEAQLTETEKQLEEANAKVEDLQDKYLRLSAEFDNFRKRTLKEKAELIKNGGEKAVSSFLPIMDDLERAIQNMEGNESIAAMKEGVELIYNKFLKIMGENGVRQIETKDKDFNTDYYEAIAIVPAPTPELKGKVLDCVQPGYMLNDKVIRHAKVVVGE